MVGLVIFILLGIPLGTWVYLQLKSSVADATVLEKSEYVYHGFYGNWKQYFRVKVKYSPSDTGAPELATVDVDEGTWDQSKAGTHVQIAYVPIALLRQIPMYHTRRLAEPLPPASSLPDAQRSASAMIKNVQHFNNVIMDSRSRSMKAWQPYDVVELSFIPEGRDEAVTAVDSVDSGKVPGFTAGKRVTIDYSLRSPRAAKIAGASREHEWKNEFEILVFPAIAALVLLFFFVQNVWKSRRAGNLAS